jgi:hypothetical protein
MSKTGLTLCALYGAVILGCVGYAVVGGLDEKAVSYFYKSPSCCNLRLPPSSA